MNHTDTIKGLLLEHPFGGPEFGGCECGQIIGGGQDVWADHLAPIIADATAPTVITTADDLAVLITDGAESDMDSADIASQVLAAGFHRDRTIATAEELNALPDGSVVLDTDGDTWHKLTATLWWCGAVNGMDGGGMTTAPIPKFGPFTVLHEGARDE